MWAERLRSSLQWPDCSRAKVHPEQLRPGCFGVVSQEAAQTMEDLLAGVRLGEVSDTRIENSAGGNDLLVVARGVEHWHPRPPTRQRLCQLAAAHARQDDVGE